MEKQRKVSPIVLYALILFVCVAATTIALTSRLNTYVIDDSGAIPIVSDGNKNTDADTTEEETSTGLVADSQSVSEGGVTTSKPTLPQGSAKPGFEAEDDNGVWSTDTEIEIFKVSYENGEHKITVNSSDGDKLIAPGTENSYTFKLKNTGNVTVSYSLDVDAFFSPDGTVIPVKARLSRYDGKWLVGSSEEYKDIPDLDRSTDSDLLGAGKYTYYTLDWEWPFESGNDEFDTYLGNLAAEGEDLTLTIIIKTVAEADWDETDSPGLTPPQTGDISFENIWITVAVSTAVIMIILIAVQIKDKKKKPSEANEN